MSELVGAAEYLASRRRRSLPARVWRFLRSNPMALTGLAIVLGMILAGILSPVVAPFDPEKPDAGATLQPPSFEHLFGTDGSGMDIFSRVIAAPRIDITIALAATILSILIGAPLGVLSGYLGRGAGEAIVRISDIVQSFPLFILAMALVAVTGQNIGNLIYAVAFLNAPIYLRLMRSQTLSERRKTFVEASQVSGNNTLATIVRHVLPNSIAPMFIQASVTIGFSILLVAGLSFIGAGVRTPTPEWGLMVANGSPNIITGQWWPSVFPGAAIALTVLGFALVGEGLKKVYEQGRL